jgi:adenosine deaminase CECR1
LAIIENTVKHIQMDHPDFRARIIVTGCKFLGQEHAKRALDILVEICKKSDLVAGFDLINHEDLSSPLLKFVPDILKAKEAQKDAKGVDCFLSSGETHSRYNENLFDAILLESKRVSHGLQLSLQPHLLEKMKQKGTCLEVCPVSNLILGYVNDLRIHPVRFMIQKGL